MALLGEFCASRGGALAPHAAELVVAAAALLAALVLVVLVVLLLLQLFKKGRPR
jgi:hypothetical protein